MIVVTITIIKIKVVNDNKSTYSSIYNKGGSSSSCCSSSNYESNYNIVVSSK